MNRLFCAVSVSLAGALMVTAPALAAQKVIVQKVSRANAGTVYIAHQLSPGHDYQVQFLGSGRKAFSVFGTEFYSGVVNRREFTQRQGLMLQGTTPKTVGLQRPTTAGVQQWIVSLSVHQTMGRGLTVRLVDLGRHR